MAQLVFVHGVATRGGAGYAQGVANRDALFKNALFQGAPLTIHSPLWGDLVPTIDKKVYETSGVTTFSLNAGPAAFGGGMGVGLGGAPAAVGPTLADFAQTQPTVALDALFAELIDRYDAQHLPIPPNDLAAFTHTAKAMMADEVTGRDGTAALVAGVTADSELAGAVEAEGAPTTYGIVNAITSAAQAVTDRLRKIASSVAFDPLADLARPAVGFFLGDVFVYLRDSTIRDGIQAKVCEALLAAHNNAHQNGEKLVVIGHSLGGVILVDMLCSPAAAGLPAGLKIDALLTVGSQPGLFQALDLFVPSAGALTPKPAGVETWYNVFDPIDPLAFRAEPIFSGVKDFMFDSITGLASAHTTYFKRPQFYARCRYRLQTSGAI